MPRISLDVTGGTFNKLEELCDEKFQNKAEVLRECLNNLFRNKDVTEEKK